MISASKSILRRLGRRNFFSFGGASSKLIAPPKLIGRPSLMLPPSFAAVEEKEEISSKMEYNFYSPSEKSMHHYIFSPLKEDMVKDHEILRFYNRGGKEEVALMQDKDTTWVGSSHGWLGLFNKNNRSMSLVNPVSGRSIPLPPLVGEPFVDEEKTLKVILSHSPTDKKFQAVAVHGSSDRAALCSPGCYNHWIPIGRWNQPKSYDDFVYSASRKAFVSATRVASTDELEFWDPSSPMETPVKTVRAPPVFRSTDDLEFLESLMETWGVKTVRGPPVSGSDPTWRTYLVPEEESGQLFMVRRYLRDHKKRVRYAVYKIESYFGGDDVQLCKSLDGLVMFIGMNHSFAVKASRFPEYRRNCIYFSGGWNWKNGNQNKPFADVYDYEKALSYSSRDYYSQLFYGNDFPFDHNLPWLTLTKN